MDLWRADWSCQVSAMATTWWLQCDQTLPHCKGHGLRDSHTWLLCVWVCTRLEIYSLSRKKERGTWTNETCKHVSPLLLLLLEEDESELSEGERLLCFLLRCLSLGLRLLLREVEEEDKEEEEWCICFSLWLTWSSRPENTHTQRVDSWIRWIGWYN